MPSLQDTKNRINSIESTKKITSAMNLVSTAKLKKARESFESFLDYNKEIREFVASLVNSKDLEGSKIFEKREVKSRLYIVFTSDMGLCGGFNSNIIKALNSSDKFITFGNKVTTYLKNRDANIIANFESSKEISTDDLNRIAKTIIELYSNEEVDEVILRSTKFINSLTFEPENKVLLPIEKIENEELEADFIFEPSINQVLDFTIPEYIKSCIMGSYFESNLCEHSVRRMTMDNATENATELIEHLQLVSNRLRQASITQEISEIVAGADAN